MLHTLLFITTYILGFVLTIVVNPAFSFVLYEAVYFFSPLERWWSSYLPQFSYSLFTVVLMFFALFVSKRKTQITNGLFAVPQFKWIYALLILYGIAWFYAVNTDGHLAALYNYLKLIIIISVAYKLIDNSRNLDYALWGYVFGSWYISFLIYQAGRDVYGRVEAIGTVDAPDSNGIASVIAPSLVICLYYFWIKQDKIIKLFFALAGVFVANAIILINSRGAILGAGISVFFFMYYMFFSSFRRRYQRAFTVFLVIAGAVGFLHLADQQFWYRVQSMQDTEIRLEQQTATTRVVFWLSALDIAKDHPFGSGFQGFDFYAPQYLPENMDSGFSRNRSVHSSWFEALTEIGYLGLAAFTLLIYSSFKSLRSCMARLKELGDLDNYSKMIMLQAALLCFVICMTFLNRLRAEILYWLILYSACSYNIFVVKSLNLARSSDRDVDSI